MLGLNCLYKDTRAVDDIKEAIKILVGDRLSDNKPVFFPAIYNELRGAGLEIDAESAGALYNEIYGGYNDSALSNEQEIIEFAGRDVVDQQKAIVDAIIGSQPAQKEVQIGNLSPEKQVATMIANMFQQATFDTTKNVKSVMKQMETLVARAAKSLLPPTTQRATPSLYENLNNFFTTEKAEFQTLRGGVNNLETLHKAVKDEVDNYIEEITQNLSDEDAAAVAEKWAAYTNGFIQSTYDLMLGKSDQNKLLNEALKQVKVDGLQIVDVNDNIKWKTLIEGGDPSVISANVKKLFEEGVKDAEGNIQNYTREEASRIGDYFERLYRNKLASVTQQKVGNQRSKNISAKNIISDFIKDQGFINLVKDKDGKLLLTQANWKDALETIRRQVGDQNGIDVVVQKLRKFLGEQTNADGSKKFTTSKIDIIEKEFRQTVAAKLVPGTAVPHALDRLIALKNLNGGKSFQNATQSALNNVVGVGELDQATIDKIKDLTQLWQNIVLGNNVTGVASTNQATNRGAYAFQALSQIDRKIREILRENKVSRSNTQRIVKYIGDTMNAASTSLLINPGNFGENIVTGFASNIGETVTTLFTHPKLFSKSNTFGDFWVSFGSHVSGGVANEVIAEEDLTADVQTGERLRLRQIGNELKTKGVRGALNVVLKAPAYAVSIVSRTIMNSFDAGFNSAILRKKTVTSIYNALRSQGLSASEALKSMDSALNISDAVNAELDTENMRIANEMRKAGLHPTKVDMELNKRDMKLSLYENALGEAYALNNGNELTPKQLRESAKAIVESAQIQSKVLTGKKQIPVDSVDPLLTVIYGLVRGMLTPQRSFFARQQLKEEQGDLKGAANAQLKAELWKNTIGRFAGGIANFLALSVTATPYGFVTARSLYNQKKTLLANKADAGDVFKAEPGDIRKYAEFHNLMRSMVVRAAMGTMVIGSFITKRLLEDEEEDDTDWVRNLMQTRSGRRVLQKYMPLGVNIAASFLYDVDDPKMNSKMERLFDVLSNTTGQSYDKWASLKTSVGRMKNNEDIGKAISSFVGSSLPTFNINQAEQITKFGTTLQSALNEKNISEVKRQEKISKIIYKQTEDWVDAAMTNGAIEAIGRALDSEEKFNRFTKK